ncbi:MAG TPA: helix-turn-helix domain-containing protein [Alphaproteobacteria bacterium]|nr:helix-turn-helix domain-containing protein [Alphaproteobacteria bacterium]
MTKIMDAAERLFALHGIEGVPLRQILIEAKQRNKYAITLYFGGKEELVVAIIGRRIEAMNVHRKRLIAEAKIRGDLDSVRTLLEVIYRPLAEVSDSTGQYTYARFLQQVTLYHSFSSRWPSIPFEGEHYDAYRRLRKQAAGLSDDEYDGLLAVIAGMFLTAITTRGLRIMEGRRTAPFGEFFRNLLNMATVAFASALEGGRAKSANRAAGRRSTR